MNHVLHIHEKCAHLPYFWGELLSITVWQWCVYFLFFFFFFGSNLFVLFCLVCLPLCLGYITINTCNHEVEVVWCGVATVNNLVPYLSIYFCRSCPVSRQPRLIFIHQLYPTYNSEFLSIPPSWHGAFTTFDRKMYHCLHHHQSFLFEETKVAVFSSVTFVPLCGDFDSMNIPRCVCLSTVEFKQPITFAMYVFPRQVGWFKMH
jgi:hypothetical protein